MEEMKKIKPGDSNHITREYFDSLLLEMRHLTAPCLIRSWSCSGNASPHRL